MSNSGILIILTGCTQPYFYRCKFVLRHRFAVEPQSHDWVVIYDLNNYQIIATYHLTFIYNYKLSPEVLPKVQQQPLVMPRGKVSLKKQLNFILISSAFPSKSFLPFQRFVERTDRQKNHFFGEGTFILIHMNLVFFM